MEPPQFDFAIVGGGPSGSIAAALLASGGARVVLVEAESQPRFKAGEHLAAQGKRAVDRLGILSPRWSERHLVVPGFVNCWSRSDPVLASAITSPFGLGLTLDRVMFEDQLRNAARDRGADVRLGWRATLQAHPRPHCWRIRLSGREEVCDVGAAHLVLATGRNRRVPIEFASRRRFDRLAFVACRFAAGGGDSRPSVECFEKGWVYTVTVPGPQFIAYVFSEGARSGLCDRSVPSLLTTLNSCPHARDNVEIAARAAETAPVWFSGPAHSSLTFPAIGEDWLLLGDAAQSQDPLSSSGLVHAVNEAAHLAAMLLCGPLPHRDRLTLENRRLELFETYLYDRRQYYAAEERWAKHPFWRAAAGDPIHRSRV